MKNKYLSTALLILFLDFLGLGQKSQLEIQGSFNLSTEQPGILEIKHYKNQNDIDNYNPNKTQYWILKKTGQIFKNIKNLNLVTYFNEGFAIAIDNNSKKKVFIDENFKVVIEFKGLNYSFTNFSDGVAWVKKDKSDPYLINKKNEILFKCIGCTQVNSFSEGLAAFSDENGQWGFLDKSGKTLFKLPKEIFYVSKFSSGMAQYYIKNPNLSDLREIKFGFINRFGETIIKPIFKYLEEVGNIEQLIAGDDDDKNKFNGEFANYSEYKSITSSDLTLPNSSAEINYLINKKGDLITDTITIRKHNNSLSNIKLQEIKNKIGYVNSQNKYIVKPYYDGGTEFSNGLAEVYLGNKKMIINNLGKVIFEYPKNENLTIINFYNKPIWDYVEGGGLGLVNVISNKQNTID